MGLVVAALVLGLVEAVARTLAGAPTPPLSATVIDDGSDWFELDGDLVRAPYQQSFERDPVPMHPGERPRVIWLGGSSVRGGDGRTPLGQEAASILPERVEVESVNLAAPGLDSGHLVAMLPEVLSLEPDILILYVGHNDLGNLSFQTRFSDSRTVWAARIRGVLSHSRAFELLDASVATLSPEPGPPPGTPKAAFDAHQRAAAHADFEINLRWIVRAAHDNGTEVVLVTPMSNPLAPPVLWSCADQHQLPRPPITAQLHHIPEHIPDTDCADFAWMRGMVAVRDGDMETAARQFDHFRDIDPTPLRADSMMPEIMRRVAASEGAVLVDVAALAKEEGNGIEPPHFFSDPVHLTPQGHRFVADQVAPAVQALL